MIKFFTYGTLRKGESRHNILEHFNAEFISSTTTAPEYKLFDLGSFPGMTANGNCAITGEVYNLPEEALITLDMIEGHPDFFYRTEIKLQDGTIAISYLFPYEGSIEIKSGDWLA